MRKYILSITIGWLSAPMFAQSVEQFLVAAGGGSNGILEWSVGELVISTESVAENIVTQGFHQTLLTITAIEESAMSEGDLMIYPNPFRSTIHIQQLNGMFHVLKFNLTDLSGQLIMTETLDSTSDEFNLVDLAAGVYFLNIQMADSSVRSYKVVKQN